MTLFSHDGIYMLLRFFHLLAGVTWIGLLYYFNFVQGAFFGETDAATKSNATQKLVPRALWWFRWAAMVTFLSGWAYLLMRGAELGGAFMGSSWGVLILMGALMGSFMWFNVWFVIWPNQKIVIQSATQAASGGKPLENAAACGARALVASRTNTMFSIPMLFFMGSASHLAIPISDSSNLKGIFGVFTIILAALEFNALKGKTGPMTTIKGVITCGFVLAAVLYVMIEIFAQMA